ncbi:hypothetical protein SLE2022_185220 [Rubroshorea leprosula]
MKLASFTPISHFLLLCCSMFCSPYFNNSFVIGTRPPSTCSGPAQGYRGMLVAPRYGPCSPVGHEKSYAVSTQILHKDELRVRFINTLAFSRKYVLDDHGKKTHQLPIPGKGLGAGNYVVTPGVGTPARNFKLTIDTGSHDTWIRCEPGLKSSSTFRKLPCDDNCTNSIKYFDGSKVEGFWASDTLTISPSYSIKQFNFVCVNRTKINGLLALGPGDNSLVTRTNVFCHCLPSEDATGYLLFGPEAREICRVGKFTPLNPQEDSGRYLVNFVGISVGNKTLKISHATLSSPGTMIDSGTVITRLPPPVYKQFRTVFRKLMEEYSLVNRPPGENLLETCYELKGYKYSTVKIPAVVLHFENIDINLDGSQVLWKEGKSPVYCLAFAGNKNDDHMVIIGNHQLQKLNVLYDIQKRSMGIGPGSCG